MYDKDIGWSDMGMQMLWRLSLGIGAYLMVAAAQAHNVGCDGQPVPQKIKTSCCGPADAHRVGAGDVSRDASGNWVIANQGRTFVVPAASVEPSPDGCMWLFYSSASPAPVVYCFLMPISL